jgi:hypothetical protein
LGQNEGPRGPDRESDSAFTTGAFAFDRDDLTQAELGMNDSRARSEPVDVDWRGGAAGD